jgi:preprotein translocase subunit SecB
MQSPIQLLSRKFINIKLEAQPTEQGTDHSFEVSHLITVLQSEEDPTQWNTKFGVRIENKPDQETAQYTGEIIIAGHFTLDAKFPEEKAEQMVYLNSGAMLYGAIRELVTSLTSQSIHGELILPAIDARSFLPEAADKEEPPS